MPTVDFIYDLDCPNVETARENLRIAFDRVGIPPRWDEHCNGEQAAPERVRGYGSPTILIDGCDIAGARPGAERCCRVYASAGGVPPVELIAAALTQALGE